jgi:hypothetical protein
MSILAGWLVLLAAFPVFPVDPPFCGIAASGAQMCGDSESEYVLKEVTVSPLIRVTNSRTGWRSRRLCCRLDAPS